MHWCDLFHGLNRQASMSVLLPILEPNRFPMLRMHGETQKHPFSWVIWRFVCGFMLFFLSCLFHPIIPCIPFHRSALPPLLPYPLHLYPRPYLHRPYLHRRYPRAIRGLKPNERSLFNDGSTLQLCMERVSWGRKTHPIA